MVIEWGMIETEIAEHEIDGGWVCLKLGLDLMVVMIVNVVGWVCCEFVL